MFSRLFGGSAPDTSSNAKSTTPKEGGAKSDPRVEKDEVLASHISKMDSLIRRKLHGTGAQYNMKVVIRGERGVGKSTLWRRLQGLPYEEKYNPTPEIQTTTINNWVYRGSQDVVKVEVWDVVDKGLARGGVSRVPEGEDLEDAVAGLPPDSSTGRGGRSLAVLDAGVVNVYQGASAIIFMVDPYRPETLDKVEKGLAEAPVELPTVVLLNFRDKLEEDAVAKASGRPGNSPPAPAQTPKHQSAPAAPPAAVSSGVDPPPSDTGGDLPAAAAAAAGPAADGAGAAAVDGKGDGPGAGATGVSGGGDGPSAANGAAAAIDGDGGGDCGAGSGTGGAWDHVVTLETARLMMDRVREADEAAGRGTGRRVSLFDCSMKNCFGLRVLYTYLNVPFLELKRKALLQQAEIASERLEKEYQELAGFIGGHSYGNYMQHLRSSDVDPTAGARTVPAAPPGRPSIATMPTAGELPSSLERRGSLESHGGGGGGGGRKEKKKKHKEKDKDKSKKKDKHRHKSGKSKKDDREEAAAPEYGGRVTDAKDFTPATKKTATDELADFFGESSEEGSDEGLRERRKVVKAINPSALANAAAAAQEDDTDSDEMPAPRTSRLKRVTAPVKPGTMTSTPKPTPTSTGPVTHSAPSTPPAIATHATARHAPTASTPRQQRAAPVVVGVERSPPALDSPQHSSRAVRGSGNSRGGTGEVGLSSAVVRHQGVTLQGCEATGAPSGAVGGEEQYGEDGDGEEEEEERGEDNAAKREQEGSGVVQSGNTNTCGEEERECEEAEPVVVESVKSEGGQDGAVAAGEEDKEGEKQEEEEEDVDGERLSQPGATGECPTPAATSETGGGTASQETGETEGLVGARGETKDPQEVGQGFQDGEADGDNDRSGVEGREDARGGEEREPGAAGNEEGGDGAEVAEEQATAEVTASGPSALQPSPTAREDSSLDLHASRRSPETAPGENVQDARARVSEDTKPDDDVDLKDRTAVSGADGGTCIDDTHHGSDPEPKESEPSEKVDAGISLGSNSSTVEEERATPAATVVMEGLRREISEGDGGAGDGARRGDATDEVEKEDSAANEAVLAETEAPESRSAEVENYEIEARGGKRGSGDGSTCEGDDDGAPDGRVVAESGSEAAAGQAEEVGGRDEPDAVPLELETSSGAPPAGEGTPSGGVVAEDFFAADASSSDENEVLTAAAAGAGAPVAPAGDTADSDDGAPTHEQPPSPRIIASSLQTGNGGGPGFTRSRVGAQRKAAPAAAKDGGAVVGGGEGGLSEAAKAAVAAALANATSSARGSSRPSRKDDDGGGPKSRKKKKKDHKERRRKGSGSRSGGDGDPDKAVVGRGSGSIGRSETGDDGRQKRSSSRWHRKPVV